MKRGSVKPMISCRSGLEPVRPCVKDPTFVSQKGEIMSARKGRSARILQFVRQYCQEFVLEPTRFACHAVQPGILQGDGCPGGDPSRKLFVLFAENSRAGMPKE